MFARENHKRILGGELNLLEEAMVEMQTPPF
jgi:hypothetical protein